MAGIIRATRAKFEENLLKLSKPIQIFFEEIKKGSRKYRNILEINNNYPLLRCSESRYKWSQTDQEVVIIIKEREQKFLVSWGHNFIPNEIRNFSFKFLFNLLKLNGAIAHFDEEKNASCTFCVIARHLPPQKETLEHFFQGCPTNLDFFTTYFTVFLHRCQLLFDKNMIFRGAPEYLSESQIFIINIELLLVCFFLYKQRVKNKLPIEVNFRDFMSVTRETLKGNSSYRRAWESWLRGGRRGGRGNGVFPFNDD